MNMDERLRRLERAAESGDSDAIEALRVHNLRLGRCLDCAYLDIFLGRTNREFGCDFNHKKHPIQIDDDWVLDRDEWGVILRAELPDEDDPEEDMVIHDRPILYDHVAAIGWDNPTGIPKEITDWVKEKAESLFCEKCHIYKCNHCVKKNKLMKCSCGSMVCEECRFLEHCTKSCYERQKRWREFKRKIQERKRKK